MMFRKKITGHALKHTQLMRMRLKGTAKKMQYIQLFSCSLYIALLWLLNGCSTPYFKNDYEDNSPTSGKLKVFYDEGLQKHVLNQAFTFEAQYPGAHVETYVTSENQAIEALYNDSCKAIVVSRLLNAKEQEAFKSKDLNPRYSAVAKSGIALITNFNTAIDSLNYQQVIDLLAKGITLKDSLKNEISPNVLFDRNNSSVIHYLLDSLLKQSKFAAHCSAVASTTEAIDFVSKNRNTIAFIDFAWLSDRDDSLNKILAGKIKFIRVNRGAGTVCELPHQSSFKLGTYPFTRTIYVIRRSGEFTLAKGFESFVAGPKGQTIFLKQGLLPTKQQERSIHVNMEP